MVKVVQCSLVVKLLLVVKWSRVVTSGQGGSVFTSGQDGRVVTSGL